MCLYKYGSVCVHMCIVLHACESVGMCTGLWAMLKTREDLWCRLLLLFACRRLLTAEPSPQTLL